MNPQDYDLDEVIRLMEYNYGEGNFSKSSNWLNILAMRPEHKAQVAAQEMIIRQQRYAAEPFGGVYDALPHVPDIDFQGHMERFLEAQLLYANRWVPNPKDSSGLVGTYDYKFKSVLEGVSIDPTQDVFGQELHYTKRFMLAIGNLERHTLVGGVEIPLSRYGTRKRKGGGRCHISAGKACGRRGIYDTGCKKLVIRPHSANKRVNMGS